MKDLGSIRGKELGFTLVELVIVVIIIGILAAIGVPQYARTLEKARAGEAWAGMAQLQNGLKIYYAQYGEYLSADPLTVEIGRQLDIQLPQSDWSFKISFRPDKFRGYQIQATRMKGRAEGTTIIMDERGNIGGTWTTEVESWQRIE